jgi:hypothetical protein
MNTEPYALVRIYRGDLSCDVDAYFAEFFYSAEAFRFDANGEPNPAIEEGEGDFPFPAAMLDPTPYDLDLPAEEAAHGDVIFQVHEHLREQGYTRFAFVDSGVPGAEYSWGHIAVTYR